jgi:hypothetical protein
MQASFLLLQIGVNSRQLRKSRKVIDDTYDLNDPMKILPPAEGVHVGKCRDPSFFSCHVRKTPCSGQPVSQEEGHVVPFSSSPQQLANEKGFGMVNWHFFFPLLSPRADLCNVLQIKAPSPSSEGLRDNYQTRHVSCCGLGGFV